MALDKTSEIITHFIGIFDTALDGLRMRDRDDGFRQAKTQETEHDATASAPYILRAPFAPEIYDAGLTPFQFPIIPTPPVPVPSHTPAGAVTVKTLVSVSGAVRPHDAPPLTIPTVQTPRFDPPAPNSNAVVAHQSNVLIDHDFYGKAPASSFTNPIVFDTQLDALVETAQTIMPTSLSNPVKMIADGTISGATLKAEYTTLAATPVESATITFREGEETIGLTVNGTTADALPDLADVLPLHLQSPPETDDEATLVDPISDGSGSATNAAAVFNVEDGHHVVAGGTLSVNEASVAVRHVDAPVIAVMGDVTSLASISQVNVIRDHNTGPVDIAPTNTSINAAAFVTNEILPNSTAPANTPAPQATAWGVTRIEGDLISVNWVQQYNFVSDHDRAEVTFSGEDTYLSFGDNITLNQVGLQEFTQGYDLIFVGGNMYDMSLISQTNIIFDSDTVTYIGDWPAEVSMGDNLAFNHARIETNGPATLTDLDAAFRNAGEDLADGDTTLSDQFTHSGMFNGAEQVQVLYISGNFVNVTSILQTNIIGDADQIRVELDALQDQHDAELTITTGSNAAANLATIVNAGIRSTVMAGGQIYDDVLLYQAEFIDTDADPTGTIPPPLASEAVAFLADDLIETAPTSDAALAQQIDATTSDVDVMGSMVA